MSDRLSEQMKMNIRILEEMQKEKAAAEADEEKKEELGEEFENSELPLLPLESTVLLPHLNLTVEVGKEEAKTAVKAALDLDMHLIAAALHTTNEPVMLLGHFFAVGCLAKIRQVVEVNESGTLRITLEGIRRVSFDTETFKEYEGEPVKYQEYPDIFPDDKEGYLRLEALRRALVKTFNQYLVETGRQNEGGETLREERRLEVLTDKIAGQVYTNFLDKQVYLQDQLVEKRMKDLLQKLQQEISIARYAKTLNHKVSRAIEKNQREYFLREQIRVINEELGESADNQTAADEYREKLAAANIDEKGKEKLAKEIEKLKVYSPQNPETAVVRSYLDTVFDLPWGKMNELKYDLELIKKQLDADHYGLENVKERILEYIAVEKLRRAKGEVSSKGPILCLVGPPGVGKTSVASSIAKAMGRDFVRMSLGGVRDEAEIRGHRKTYIGSMPGRIINALIQAQSDNPLILMDEIDKLSADYKGDPSSALLEVLDPEQNNSFRDHYLELPYDLSHVLFITTANRRDQIPPALYDRMEVIELNGYTVPEKYEIAKRHLLPKQMKQNALDKGQLSIYKAAYVELISNYTAEAGVRQLERVIAKICRRAALEIAENEKAEKNGEAAEPKNSDKSAQKNADAAEPKKAENSRKKSDYKIKVTAKNLEDYAGKPKYRYDKAGRKAIAGLVRGLAWTAAGGDTLEIEALAMPGSGKLNVTGRLGDVMKESCQVALAYVRAHSARYGVDAEFYEKHDIHVHIPEGATPKDGPSAGITLVTAIMSAVSKRKVDPGLAMTGEVTLRGRVLPIGGLKEKLIAADRAGIKRVIIPEENRRDIDDVPASVLDKLEILYVSDAEEVLDIVLGEAEQKKDAD